jgi:hypothetical protein
LHWAGAINKHILALLSAAALGHEIIGVPDKDVDERCVQDGKLKELLLLYHQVGRKVFLATNSLWEYTNVVMNFLIDGRVGSEMRTEWLQVQSAGR